MGELVVVFDAGLVLIGFSTIRLDRHSI